MVNGEYIRATKFACDNTAFTNSRFTYHDSRLTIDHSLTIHD